MITFSHSYLYISLYFVVYRFLFCLVPFSYLRHPHEKIYNTSLFRRKVFTDNPSLVFFRSVTRYTSRSSLHRPRLSHRTFFGTLLTGRPHKSFIVPPDTSVVSVVPPPLSSTRVFLSVSGLGVTRTFGSIHGDRKQTSLVNISRSHLSMVILPWYPRVPSLLPPNLTTS